MSFYNKWADKAWRWIAKKALCPLGKHDYPKAGNLGGVCTRCGKKVK